MHIYCCISFLLLILNRPFYILESMKADAQIRLCCEIMEGVFEMMCRARVPIV